MLLASYGSTCLAVYLLVTCMHAWLTASGVSLSSSSVIVLLSTKCTIRVDVVEQLRLSNFHMIRHPFLGCLKCSSVPLSKLDSHYKSFYLDAKVNERE